MARWNQSGYSILELMVAFAVFVILAGIAAPNLTTWLRTYRVKGAVRDLYSNMQRAKIGAIKDNRPWKIRFEVNGAYDVLRCFTTLCETGTVNTDYEIFKTVSFADAYKGRVEFKHPTTGPAIEDPLLVFNPTGLTDQGFVYLTDKDRILYYRVGTEAASGAVVIEHWDGSTWI